MPRRAAPKPEFTEPTIPELESLAKDPEPGKPRRRTAATKVATAPARRTPAKAATRREPSLEQLTAQVTEEAYALAGVLVAGWEMRDPDCAGIWWDEVNAGGQTDERLHAFVARIVKMVSRSPGTLRYLAKGGLLSEAVLTLQLVIPVARAMWYHHGPGGVGHGQEMNTDEVAERYPAPALA